MLLVQRLRSPAQEPEAAADADLAPPALALRQLGVGYSAARYPLAFALFDAARADMTRAVDVVKARGPQRARPHARDRRVQPSLSIKRRGGNAWPSGRAAATRVWASVLGDIFPERRDALLAAARRSGELRLIGGVHYPTDIVAGERLADAFLARLRADPAYRVRLLLARAGPR